MRPDYRRLLPRVCPVLSCSIHASRLQSNYKQCIVLCKRESIACSRLWWAVCVYVFVRACAPVRIIHVPRSHSAPVVSLVFLLSSLIRPPDPQSPSWKTPQRSLIDFPLLPLLWACEAAAAARVSAGRESKERKGEKNQNLKLISAGLRRKIAGGSDNRRPNWKKTAAPPPLYATANTEEMKSALPLSTPPHFSFSSFMLLRLFMPSDFALLST